mmetsp:Transcript_6761/g.17543  ORF Transcript_6761/g.17543 Transcript_6761/m.17543 type:complete len:479 (-) Transcript_6761:637-2073(-)
MSGQNQIQRFNTRLANQRVADEKTADLVRAVATDKMLAENFKSDGRVVQRRILNEQRSATQSQFATQQLMSASIAQQREAVLREQDERLAAEIARRKTQSVREAKNVQRICEQSEELRELEEKLKAAYMNKEREAQIKESAHLIARQAEAEATMAREMEADRQRGLQAEAYREYLRLQDGHAMRAALDLQMEEKEAQKADAYQQFLKEKEMVDKVVDQIIAEDRAELEARHKKEAETKEYIDTFIKDQEAYKEGRRREIEAENAKIRAYAEAVMARETAQRLAREKDQNAKDAMLEKISGDMAARQREADEMEALRNELVIQETEEKILQKEKEKIERAVQQRMDIALANEYQRQLKAIRREEEKQEEEQFRQAMLDKFAEDDRLDQMNAQRRRMKQLEHRKEIERLLELRREKYEQERASELAEQMDAERVEAIRQQIIEEERKRMLAAHAKNLGLEHLPKGVLSSEADMELFGRRS